MQGLAGGGYTGRPLTLCAKLSRERRSVSISSERGVYLYVYIYIYCIIYIYYMGVSKNRGTPKWMIYNEKPY